MPEAGYAGIWIINGRNVQAGNNTVIEEKYGRIAVGALVKVEGNYSGDKSEKYRGLI